MAGWARSDPALVAQATGGHLPQVAAALAPGAVPNLTPTLQRAAAVQFLYPSVSGRLTQLGALTALRFGQWLDLLLFPETRSAPRLTRRSTTVSRTGWSGADQAECERRLALVLMHVTARIDAPSYTTSCIR